MSSQKNPNIGAVVCGWHGCTDVAAVRRSAGGKLYVFCGSCGQINPSGQAGQDRILEAATLWGAEGTPPPGTPRWIAENWPRDRRRHDPGAAEPIEAPAAPVEPGNTEGSPGEPDPQPPPKEQASMARPAPPKAKPRPKKPEPEPDRREEPAPADTDDDWWS